MSQEQTPKEKPLTKKQLKDKMFNSLFDIADALEEANEKITPTASSQTIAEAKAEMTTQHAKLRGVITVIDVRGLM